MPDLRVPALLPRTPPPPIPLVADRGGAAAPPRVARRELGWAALLAALLAALYLSPALVTGRVFSPADVLYTHYPWRDVAPAGWSAPGNALVGEDSAFVFEPWLLYSGQRLHAGALPLWNPDNLLGVPLIGNMQSAVFSPLSWPVLLWPNPRALVLPAWLKLWLALLGTYLLAREVGRCRPVAAALAAIAFGLGAFMSIWLLYPLGSSVAWLPWIWWATARLIDAPGRRAWAGLAGLVALNLLAGHPETSFHIAEATGAFALFYAWQSDLRGVRARARRLGLAAAAYGCGALLAAVQVLPFLDYLSQSTIWQTRGTWPSPWFPFRDAWTLFSPAIFGSPVDQTWWDPGSTYNEITTYCGVLPLLLAPLAFAARGPHARRLALFLVALGAVCMGVVYRWPLVFDAVTALPLMRALANQRLLIFVQLGLALLGALGAEALLARLPAARERLLWAVAASSVALLVLGVLVPWLLIDSYFAVPADPPWAQPVWRDGLARAALLLGGAGLLLGGVVALWGWRPQVARVLVGLLPALLVADLLLAYGGYNPTLPLAEYYPQTPATRFLQAQQASAPPFRVVATGRTFPPNASLSYGLADPRNYDALEPTLFHELAIGIEPAIRIKPGGSATVYRSVRSPLISLFNVRYVLAAPDDDPNYAVDVRQETSVPQALLPLGAGPAPGQTFTAGQDNLAAIQVRGSTAGGTAGGTVMFHLKTAPSATSDLVAVPLDLTGLPDGGYWWIRFPPIPATRGRQFYFYLDAPPTRSPRAALFYNPDDAYAGGTRTADGQAAAGDLAFRVLALPDSGAPAFTRVLDGGLAGTSVFENRRAQPRAWLTHHVEVQPDPATHLARLTAADFDPARTALLAAPLPASEPLPAAPPVSGADSVTITRYEPEAVEIATRSPAAGVLILSDQAFSGWQATLDGQPAPILTADHALRGLYVPAGAHTVGFAYRPPTFTAGAALSVATLVLLAALIAWPGRRGAMRG